MRIQFGEVFGMLAFWNDSDNYIDACIYRVRSNGLEI